MRIHANPSLPGRHLRFVEDRLEETPDGRVISAAFLVNVPSRAEDMKARRVGRKTAPTASLIRNRHGSAAMIVPPFWDVFEAPLGWPEAAFEPSRRPWRPELRRRVRRLTLPVREAWGALRWALRIRRAIRGIPWRVMWAQGREASR